MVYVVYCPAVPLELSRTEHRPPLAAGILLLLKRGTPCCGHANCLLANRAVASPRLSGASPAGASGGYQQPQSGPPFSGGGEVVVKKKCALDCRAKRRTGARLRPSASTPGLAGPARPGVTEGLQRCYQQLLTQLGAHPAAARTRTSPPVWKYRRFINPVLVPCRGHSGW